MLETPRTTPTLRTLLFFPGTRPYRLPNALASGADAVCLDLEDGVAEADKDRAREAAVSCLSERAPGGPAVFVRVNPTGTPTGELDMDALGAARVVIDGIVLPKVDGPNDVVRADQRLRSYHLRVPLIASIETARGLARVEEIATAGHALRALLFGGVDLSADLGCAMAWDALLYARSRLVHAAALGRLDSLDMPFLDLADVEGLGVEAAAARRLGFTGKLAIHPRQVAVVQDAFTPSPEDVARARRVIAAYEEGREGVFAFEGRMVDTPVVTAAYRTLAAADRPGSQPQVV